MSSEAALQNAPTYKIILVGDIGVGKTSLFWRYLQNQTLPNHPMTIIDFRYKYVNLYEQPARLCIWDTAGQEKFRCIVATYFKLCHGVIMVCDLSNKQSWKNIKFVWYDLAYKRASKATFVLFGNKSDLPCQVQIQEINRWCKQKGVYFVKTCAHSGQNVDQAFFTLAALIDSKQDQSLSIFSSMVAPNGNISFTDTTLESQTHRFGYFQSNCTNQMEVKSSQSFFLKKNRPKNIQKQCCK